MAAVRGVEGCGSAEGDAAIVGLTIRIRAPMVSANLLMHEGERREELHSKGAQCIEGEVGSVALW